MQQQYQPFDVPRPKGRGLAPSNVSKILLTISFNGGDSCGVFAESYVLHASPEADFQIV